MRLTRLLTLRSLLARPVRMLLSTIGIVLGVASILAIGLTNQSALNSVSRLFEDTSGKASLVVVSNNSDQEGFDQDILTQVARFPAVIAAVPSLHATTILADEAPPSEVAINFFGTSLGGVTLYGIDPLVDSAARSYEITAGRFLSEDPEAPEVVLVDVFAEQNELNLGDRIDFVSEGGSEELLLVGLIAQEGPGRLNRGAFGVIPLEMAQNLTDREEVLDQIDIVTEAEDGSTTALESLKAGLQDQLGDEYSVIFPAAQGKRMTQTLDNYQIGLNFLSGMALFVGAFLIYNAFSMSVVERTRELGMLRTIGMTRPQVTRQVLGEAAILGLIGAALGVGLGFLLAIGLSRLMELLLSQEVNVVDVPMNLVLTSVIIGVLVTIVAAAIPAWQASRISPLEALQVRGTAKESWIIRYGWWLGLTLLVIAGLLLLWNPFPYDVQFRLGSIAVIALFLGGTLVIPASVVLWERMMRPIMRIIYGNSGRLGSLNIQRAKLRTTLTVAALMVGVSMMIVVWGMTESFKGDLVDWIDGYAGGDIYISSSVKMRRALWSRLEALDGVAAVSPVRYHEINWITPNQEKQDILLMAVDPGAYDQVTSFTFSEVTTGSDPSQAMAALNSGDKVFISSVLAELHGLAAGNTITLITRSGPKEFEIAAVVVDYYNQGLVVDGSMSDLRRYYGIRDANMLLAKVSPGHRIEDVLDTIETDFGDRYHLTIESNQVLKEQVSQLMNQAFTMFDVLALIALIIAFLGIMNTMTMNIMERTQEIGMLRSIGMTRGQVVLMILAEAGLLGVIGGVMGLIFGLILTRILILSMSAMSGYQIDYLVPNSRVLMGFAIAVVVAQLAAILPAVRASRIRILDAIHQE